MKYALGNMLNGAGSINPDGLALDLQFAADKTLTARRGPTPVFSRGSTGTFVGSNGLIQSAAINAPRFDHDPVTLASRGLLIEEPRQNILSFSESISNTAWNAFASASATDNQTTSPSGVASSASRLTANAGTDTRRTRVRITNITTGGSTYSASAFVKAGASNFGVVYMSFNKSGIGVIRNCDAHIVFSTGVVTKTGVSNANFTVTSTPYPDGWYRITISATSNASIAVEDQVVLGVGIAFNGTGGSGTFAGTETVFAWGAQLEAGSFATSYIPTTTGTLARSADVCSITGGDFTNLYNQSEGTLLSEASIANLVGNNRGIVQIDDDLTSNFIRHVYGVANGGFSSLIRANIDAQTALSVVTGAASTIQKRVIAYAGTSFASSANGAAVETATRTMPTGLNNIKIGYLFTGSFYLNGHLASIRYYKKRLPNAKLQALTV
jgi:hypothetical protein